MQEHRRERSEFLDSLRKGALIGIGLLVLILPPLHMMKKAHAPAPPAAVATAPQAGAPAPATPEPAPAPQATPAPNERSTSGLQLADFRGEEPSAAARLVANWIMATHDAGKRAFVIVDKKDARVYVFGPEGQLRDSAPALLGAARGDDSFPGIGDKPLEAVRPEEKTTPAGRFVAEPGRNASNEDVVWVDYEVAVSMHRVRPLVAQERRLERLATLSTDDNRISFGCINLPVTFYENVLRPSVQKHGAIVYVLPEVKGVDQVFGAYDVTDPQQVAAAKVRLHKPSAARPPVQKVALSPAR